MDFFINADLNKTVQNQDRLDYCTQNTPCLGECHECIQNRCIDQDNKCPTGQTCTKGQCSTCEKGYILFHSPQGTHSICCPKNTNGVQSYWESIHYLKCCPEGTSSHMRGNDTICVEDKCPPDKPNRLTFTIGETHAPICCPQGVTSAASQAHNSVSAGGDGMHGYCCLPGYEAVSAPNGAICSAVTCPAGQEAVPFYQGWSWKKTCCPIGTKYAATRDTVIGHSGCCGADETLVYGAYESTCLPNSCPTSAPARITFIFDKRTFEWCCPAGTKVAAETKGIGLWFYNHGDIQPYCCRPNQILGPNPDWPGKLECQDCPTGTIPNDASDQCIPCETGYIINNTGTACVACPDGTYPNDSKNVCI